MVVTVQVPDAGNADKATLPVANAQVGCVISPTIGAEGVLGCATIVALEAEATDVHAEAFVTVKV